MALDPLLTRLKPFDIVAFMIAQDNDGSMTLTEAIAALQGDSLTHDCPQCATNAGNTGVIQVADLGITIPCPTCLGYLKTQAPYVTKCGTFTALVISGGLAIVVAGTSQLAATVAGGQWSTSDGTVATVDANKGLVTAVAAGTATITYTVSGVSATATITVTAQ